MELNLNIVQQNTISIGRTIDVSDNVAPKEFVVRCYLGSLFQTRCTQSKFEMQVGLNNDTLSGI